MPLNEIDLSLTTTTPSKSHKKKIKPPSEMIPATNELKTDMVDTLLDVWKKYGRKKFIDQAKQRFDDDAIKMVKEIYLPLMPREAPKNTNTQPERAVIHMDFTCPTPPKITMEDNGSK